MVATIIFVILAIVAVVLVAKAIVIVPQQSAYIVERLGRYSATLEAGLHILTPFIDRVAYKVPLQEIPMDTDPQGAITADNVSVQLDGVLYYRITDAHAAAYGTSDYETAIEMLAKTTLRSEVGKRELDKLLEERSTINTAVVAALDEAGSSWGVKVMRYEVKDITPPTHVLEAMQMQLTAERQKRALIARSEGQRAEEINLAEGKKAAAIAESEGEKAAAINRAEGEAAAILAVAEASAQALEKIGAASQTAGGEKAMQLKVAEQYVAAFANIAKQGNTVVVPANMGDLASLITGAMSITKGVGVGATQPTRLG
jgi:regulator of protease activity HflC (stomatin/prohibitin superfamily)